MLDNFYESSTFLNGIKDPIINGLKDTVIPSVCGNTETKQQSAKVALRRKQI